MKILYVLLRSVLIAIAGCMFTSLPVLPVAGIIALVTLLFSNIPTGALGDGLNVNDTSYAGEVLDIFISNLVTGFDTAKKGLIKIESGIKKRLTIPALKVAGLIQAPKTTPTHGGAIDVDARVLEPQEVMGYLEFLPKQFESHWLAVQMNPLLLDRELPVTAEAAITDKFLEGIQQWLDPAIWQSVKDDAAIATAVTDGLDEGDNTYIFFDGLLKKIYDDINADANFIATPVALTAANVINKFKLVKAQIPKALKQDQRLKYLVSYTTAEIYGDAQKAQTNKGVDETSAGVMKFDGKEVVPLAGLPDDTIIAVIATQDNYSNLWLGVNDTSDMTSIKLDRVSNPSELFFIKLLMKLDVNHAYGNEIVMYTTFFEA